MRGSFTPFVFAVVLLVVSGLEAAKGETIVAEDCLMDSGAQCVVDTDRSCPMVNLDAYQRTEAEAASTLTCSPADYPGYWWCCDFSLRVLIDLMLKQQVLKPLYSHESCRVAFQAIICASVCSPSSSLFVQPTTSGNYTIWLSQNSTAALFDACVTSCDAEVLGIHTMEDINELIGTVAIGANMKTYLLNISVDYVDSYAGFNPETGAALDMELPPASGHDLHGCGCYTGRYPDTALALPEGGFVNNSCCTTSAGVVQRIEELNLDTFNASAPVCVSGIKRLLYRCLCTFYDFGVLWGRATTDASNVSSVPLTCYITESSASALYRSCTCDVPNITMLVALRSLFPSRDAMLEVLSGAYVVEDNTVALLSVAVGANPAAVGDLVDRQLNYKVIYPSNINCTVLDTPSSSDEPFAPESSSGKKSNALAIALGICIPLLAIGIAIAFFGMWLRRRIKKRPMEISEIEMLNLCENEAEAIAKKSVFISKTVLCFTPAMTVEVGRKCRDTVSLHNHSTADITICLLPVQHSFKFTLETQPSAPTVVPPKGSIDLVFDLTLHCTTTVKFDVPLDLGEGGTKARISAVVSSAPSYLLDWDEVQVGQKLGEGMSATVFRGQYRGLETALKCFRCAELDESLRNEYLAEAKLLMGLHHPCVVSLYGICEHPQLTMVLEFAPLGSLGSVLEGAQQVSPLVKLRIAQDAAKGMTFLHSCNVLHRDLKPDNLLLFSLSADAPVLAKITDFGASRLVLDNSTKAYTKGIGTPAFMAPEVLQGKPYSMKADVYSFAILVWQLWSEKSPWEHCENMWDIVRNVSEGHRLPIPEVAPSEVASIIADCWQGKPEQRPEFSELMQRCDQAVRGAVAAQQ